VEVRNKFVLFCLKKGADCVGHQIELQSQPAAARSRRPQPPCAAAAGRLGPDGPKPARWAHGFHGPHGSRGPHGSPLVPMGPHGLMKVYGLICCWPDYVISAGLFRTPTCGYVYVKAYCIIHVHSVTHLTW